MKVKEFTLLEPAPDKCQECAVGHLPDQPHNLESLYYQFKFYKENGRCPTWKDAMAHCSPGIQEAWKKALKRYGVWTDKEAEGK